MLSGSLSNRNGEHLILLKDHPKNAYLNEPPRKHRGTPRDLENIVQYET